MKIDNSGKLSGTYSTQSKPSPRASSSSSSSASAGDDSVKIDSLASKLSAIGNDPSTQQPSFDAAKVDQIKSAIANGSFNINADKIADGLISSARELLKG
ncbi:flagellar biosynthesis anti-sigma factor FlgM [Chromobacterium vaccinii]|uniref:Negative regulator of flagellin synthesis n=1 Tax=Chromobacterium vaccinii TaxID=1108595 RepID=A0ABV0FBE0_9NEIS|nr:flagellar biosynthesis anti-sigma factor FlgM [Chromobacterium vaccinii]MBX9349793.1 flagellar biosynthesis anti-sigma factor FlgM [Chromobacterium vaccinii]MCD4486573.1 flagellar biosynthesis anti-sigma factor FlgM [Chromobacterium vaccinii]MCD4500622.1 flagellar biosynthesis anti-sigma factor FlgM [Chromobacterium vaccinii]